MPLPPLYFVLATLFVLVIEPALAGCANTDEHPRPTDPPSCWTDPHNDCNPNSP